MSIRVLKPGPMSSLQDLGRVGYQRFGVIVSGAMDEWSHRVANLLAGNLADEATLEITLMGPSLFFEKTALLAIVGADLSPRIGEAPVPMGRPVLVRAGSQLDFGRRAFGCRAYLAVHGGFAVAPVMDSRSTYLRAGFGGFEGRALRKGDVLPVGEREPHAVFASLGRKLDSGSDAFACLPEDTFATIAHPATEPRALRTIAGQQWNAFTDEARSQFMGAEFRVNANSDRMGYRLEGPVLALRAPLEMISEGVAFGTVQVPPDGNPIVLMADRQTAGGYPKIAAVASVDLPLLAQTVPQQGVRFERVSLEDAQRLYLQREVEFDRIRRSIETLKGAQ